MAEPSRDRYQESEGEHRVGMLLDVLGARGTEAVGRLRSALEGATVDEPDRNGVFEVVLRAPSFEAALDRVWDAVASAGVDDRLRFTEHPSIPGHWRARSG